MRNDGNAVASSDWQALIQRAHDIGQKVEAVRQRAAALNADETQARPQLAVIDGGGDPLAAPVDYYEQRRNAPDLTGSERQLLDGFDRLRAMRPPAAQRPALTLVNGGDDA